VGSGSEPQPLHHCFICSPAVNTRISDKTSPMWANTCDDSGLVIDGSICPSTAAHEGFQTPVICWGGMWNPFYVGMEPELCHL